jgi:hypothetical protein
VLVRPFPTRFRSFSFEIRLLMLLPYYLKRVSMTQHLRA